MQLYKTEMVYAGCNVGKLWNSLLFFSLSDVSGIQDLLPLGGWSPGPGLDQGPCPGLGPDLGPGQGIDQGPEAEAGWLYSRFKSH